MSKHPLHTQIRLPIYGLGSHGEGVGRLDGGYTVFVEGALPSEEIEAQLFYKQKKYGKARLKTILSPSPHRVEPPCPIFDRCGGCQLMHLSYDEQLVIKRQRVVDALIRIGKMEEVSVLPCIPSPLQTGYRNKIQLQVKGSKMGFYERSSHNLVKLDGCLIHCPLGEEVYQKIRSIVEEAGRADLKHLIIKSAVHREEVLILLVTGGGMAEHELSDISKKMMECHPSIKGVVHNLNRESGNVVLGPDYQVLAGSLSIREKLCGMDFVVSPASFFQVNPHQAENLYQKALEWADLKGYETVLDAYCGVGTLSLFFAKRAGKVIGVESVPEAIKDAKENSRLNQVENVHFFCAYSEQFIKTLSQVDVLLMNPPRKGCELSFLEEIGRLMPKTLLYISCDPATLARDLLKLCLYGYRVVQVQPFDMFPQTAHVECLVALSCISS